MAEQVISPGVFLNENVPVTTQAPIIPAGAAIVGPTVLGPVNIPTIVTTYSEYKTIFGSTYETASNTFSYLTSISAQKFFANGGQRLLVTRVANGTYSSAQSTTIGNDNAEIAGNNATASFIGTDDLGDAVNKEIRLNFTASDNTETNFRFLAFANGGTQPQDDVDGKLYYFEAESAIDAQGPLIVAAFKRALSGSDASGSHILDGVQYVASTNTFILTGSGNDVTRGNGANIQTGSVAAFNTAAEFGGGVTTVGTNAFSLKTISQGDKQNSSGSESAAGILTNGTKDNLRWEITNRNTSSGDFTLTIRRGNDTAGDKLALETYRGVNLDPRSPNFVAKRVGSQFKTLEGSGTDNVYIGVNGEYPNVSKYVYVSNVSTTTVDYLDEEGNIRVADSDKKIPLNQSGSFKDAEGSNGAGSPQTTSYNNIGSTTQGLAGSDYDDIITLFKDKDAYPFSVISAPGLLHVHHSTQLAALITNLESRGDSILPIDLVAYGAALSTVTDRSALLNTSYAAAYWPWVKVFDNDLNKSVWCPASTVIPAVYAANDRSAEAWFAPAGFNRGGLPGVTTVERGLKRSVRDTLYEGKVNPIATFPNAGFVVYGQKTLQSKASATDRVNVRRLLIALKDFIGQTAQSLIFEPNTLSTRNAFLSTVNPFLDSVQQRQGLFAFKVVMDTSNNGPNVIDQNELRGTIFLQPTKTAEFIVLDFNVTPTGAEFPG